MKKDTRMMNYHAKTRLRYILNRMGYQLKRIQKTKPIKKIPETNAIFENVTETNRQADKDPNTLRISIDAKAKVNIGEFSERMENPEKKNRKRRQTMI